MSDNILAAVDRFLAASRRSNLKKLAVFDCDGTVIRGDIGELVFCAQIEKFLFKISPADAWTDHPHREDLDALFHHLADLPAEARLGDEMLQDFAEMLLAWYFDQLKERKTEKACADIVRLFAGFTREETREICASIITEELHAPLHWRTLGRRRLPKGFRYIQDSIALLTHLQSKGCEIWAISGSSQWSVEPIFKPLGIHPNKVIGIDLVARLGVLTSEVKTPVPVLRGKVEALKQHERESPMIVVGDSAYDLPLFHYSGGLKVLVNTREETAEDLFKEMGLLEDSSWLLINGPKMQN